MPWAGDAPHGREVADLVVRLFGRRVGQRAHECCRRDAELDGERLQVREVVEHGLVGSEDEDGGRVPRPRFVGEAVYGGVGKHLRRRVCACGRRERVGMRRSSSQESRSAPARAL
mgnify:FL=1